MGKFLYKNASFFQLKMSKINHGKNCVKVRVMFITTAYRTNEKMIQSTKIIANQLQIKYVPRMKQSIAELQSLLGSSCIVVGKERLELYPFGERNPFFFHPNSAMFRVKRIMNGEDDPFVEAAKLSTGMSVLDCTLGLASDSIVASVVVGESGSVIGVEQNEYLAYLVRIGLKNWSTSLTQMNQAMSQIKVVHAHHLAYLKQLADNSVDCVYFDPMFEKHISRSDGISALTTVACEDGLSLEVINEARRVANNRVVLKDYFRSTRFEQFGFAVKRRKSAKFHFGVIEKN